MAIPADLVESHYAKMSALKIMVVSALKDEYDGFHALAFDKLYDTVLPIPIGGGTSYRVKFPRIVNIVEYCALDSGVDAAGKIEAEIGNINPDCVIMVGKCAGYRLKSSLCDVLVSTKYWQYSAGKIMDGDFLPNGNCVDVERCLTSCAEAIQPEKLSTHGDLSPEMIILWYLSRVKNGYGVSDAPVFKRIQKKVEWSYLKDYCFSFRKVDRPNEITATGEAILLKASESGLSLKCFPNAIRLVEFATGNSVVSSDDEWRRLHHLSRNIVGLDMESGYIAKYCNYLKIPFITVKAVSDYGDGNKGDSVADFCYKASAETAIQLINNIMRKPSLKKC